MRYNWLHTTDCQVLHDKNNAELAHISLTYTYFKLDPHVYS